MSEVKILEVQHDPPFRHGVFIETAVRIYTDQPRDGCAMTRIDVPVRWNGLLGFKQAVCDVPIPPAIGIGRRELLILLVVELAQYRNRKLESFPTPGDLLESTLKYLQDT